MTREEAIKVLENAECWGMVDAFLPCGSDTSVKVHDALDMAIAALRAQQAPMKLGSICRAALQKWGDGPQVAMVFEEMAELQKELCKHMRGADNVDHIAEEIADVHIMLEQMMILHDCRELVEAWKSKKPERLERRINGG